MKLQVMTANRLVDGAVVYLDGDHAWREHLAGAVVAADADASAALTAAAERAVAARTVVDPYLIEVTRDDIGIRPVRYREVIRATGPTVSSAPAAR